jgi:hypothetical protein
MVFPVIGGDGKPTGYEIDNSLRFNNGDNPKLAFTPSSAVVAERKTFTISCWVKRGNISTVHYLWEMGGNDNATDRFFARFDASDKLKISDSGTIYRETNRLFRDPSAWYHIVVALDTTDGTADNRVKVYVNGVQETSFATSNNPGQNDQKGFSDDSEHTIGRTGIDNGFSFDGYMADFNAVGGSQLAPTSFGETNDNGVWIPKKYTGSYGTNGFFLEFQQTGTSANSSGIGADTSGNDNHFTPTNLAATDITTDTPTNNFATLNIVNKYASPVVAEGALEYDSNSSSGSSLVSTIAPSNGKWYVEVKALTSTMHIGVSEVGLEAFNVKGQGATRPNINYQYGGGVEIDGSIIDNEATFTSNDILGFALNLDDGELIIYKNGTALNSGTAYNLHTNTTHGNTGFSVQTATGSGNTKASFNFGNPAFSISSGNADANGYGNFEYAPPSGYYALCTKNLAEYG